MPFLNQKADVKAVDFNQKLRRSLFSASLGFAFSLLTILPQAFAQTGFDVSKCPKTDVEWRAFQDAGAVKLAKFAADEDDDSVSLVTRKLNNTFKNCFSLSTDLFGKQPELQASLMNLKQFSAARSVEGLDHFAMGFNVPDAQYFKETSGFTAVPADLQTPEILSMFSDPKRIDEALKMLESLNKTYAPDQQMIFFRYTSQHLTTPDASRVFGRVLIVVPGVADANGDKVDRWVQFGVPEEGRGHTQNVSVVAIVTHANKKTDIYFKDHFRMYDKSAIYLKSRFDVDGTGDSCVACHKSGVLPIFPKPGSLADIDQPKLEAVNRVFRQYGPPAFGGYLSPEDEGPGLGAVDDISVAKRTPEFFAQCTDGIKFDNAEASHQAIANTMNCAHCHNSARLGSLNYPLNTKEIETYVRGGLMPPRSNLSTNEKEGLLKCLKAEYLGTESSRPSLLLNWLKGTWSDVVSSI